MQTHHVQLKEYVSKWCELQENLLECSYAKQRKESLEKVEAAWHLLHDLKGSLEGNNAHDGMLGNAMLKLEEALGQDGRFPLGAEPAQSVQRAPVASTQEVHTEAVPTGAHSTDVFFAERGDEAVPTGVEPTGDFFAERGDDAEIVEDTVVQSTTDAVTTDITRSKYTAASRASSVSDDITFHSSGVLRLMGEVEGKMDVLKSVTQSDVFDSITALVICLNAITMGISANYDMNHVNGPESTVLSNLEIAFVCWYTVEILVRFIALGKQYFLGKGWKWNIFDVALVLLAVCELGPGFFSGLNVSFLRTARLMKMAKLIRIVRLLKTFKPLRLILSSIMGSVGAVLWSSVLILIVMYVCSICFLQGCVSLLEGNSDVSQTIRVGIDDYWGSVLLAMHTLFILSFGGASVLEVADSLWEAGIIYYSVLLAYMLFFAVVVVNTVGSIFLDAVLQNSADDDEMRVQMQLEKKEEYMSVLKDFFNEVDDDGDGVITLEEFSEHMKDPRLYTFAESLDIEVLDAQQFFAIMSNHGSCPVDINTFVVGCIRLKGSAKAVDLYSVSQMVKHVNRNVENLYSCLEGEQDARRTSSVEANVLHSVFEIVINVQRNVERLCSGLVREQYSKSTSSVELKEIASL